VTNAPLWSAHVTEHGSTHTVTLAGELDLTAADGLRHLLVAQLDEPGTTDVVANLAGVTFLDSAALGALIVVYRHAEDADRQFTLSEPARSVRRVLEIGGVYDILVSPGAVP
jgi:anti-anti-sigma factor